MPTAPAPAPFTVRLMLAAATVRITTADRPDAAVEVRPADPTHEPDRRAAERTTVEHRDGSVRVEALKWNTLRHRGGAVDVDVEVPVGADVRIEAASMTATARGRLGRVTVESATAEVDLEQCTDVTVQLATGALTVEAVHGRLAVMAATAGVRLGALDGTASVQTSSGTTEIGALTGTLDVQSANGAVVVGHLRGALVANNAHGDIRVAEVAAGSVRARSASGSIDVGVAEGTAAWLDVRSDRGRIRSELDPTAAPTAGETAGENDSPTVEIRARTKFGDVAIRRA